MIFHHSSFYLHYKIFTNPASTYTMIFPPYDRKYAIWHFVLVTEVGGAGWIFTRDGLSYHTAICCWVQRYFKPKDLVSGYLSEDH